jgi:hypothetical protein
MLCKQLNLVWLVQLTKICVRLDYDNGLPSYELETYISEKSNGSISASADCSRVLRKRVSAADG